MKLGLAIGLNAVDPNAYKGWSGELYGCVADARANAGLYGTHGFTMLPLLNERATLEAVRDEMWRMAVDTNAGDSVVITSSGHGARYGGPLLGYNETICLWDGQMSDSTFNNLLCEFKPDVRVIVEFDHCNSGGMGSRALLGKPKRMDRDWTRIIPEPERVTRGTVSASVLLMAACRADELASDGYGNGAYTGSRLQARDEFSEPPTFAAWFEATERIMLRDQPQQHPQRVVFGPDGVWDTPIG